MLENKELARLAWLNECEGWLELSKSSMEEPPYIAYKEDGLIYAWWQGQPGEMQHYLMVPPGYQSSLYGPLSKLTQSNKKIHSGIVLRYLHCRELPEWPISLAEAGFYYLDSAPVMVCDLDNYIAKVDIAQEFSIQVVKTDHLYQSVIEFISQIFGGSIKTNQFLNSFIMNRIYAAFQYGNLAGSCTLWPFAGVAGIYSVCTNPKYRNKGIGKALVNYLMREAGEFGITFAVLRTTELVEPFYQKCGFWTCGRVDRWVRFWDTT